MQSAIGWVFASPHWKRGTRPSLLLRCNKTHSEDNFGVKKAILLIGEAVPKQFGRSLPLNARGIQMFILQISAVVTLAAGLLVTLLSNNLAPDVVLAIIATLS